MRYACSKQDPAQKISHANIPSALRFGQTESISTKISYRTSFKVFHFIIIGLFLNSDLESVMCICMASVSQFSRENCGDFSFLALYWNRYFHPNGMCTKTLAILYSGLCGSTVKCYKIPRVDFEFPIS